MERLLTFLSFVLAAEIGAASTATPGAYYDAEIKGANLFVHAGPGANFYPTAMLRPGQVVTVAGPVKDGWVPILPPSESFSWIEAEKVKENRDGSGVIANDGTRTWVGSTLSDARQVHQVVLARGDVVQIIDEQLLSDRRASARWFKILPPAGERRYITAESLTGVVNSPGSSSNGTLPAGGPGMAVPEASASPSGPVLPIAARVGQRVFPPGEVLHRSSLRWAHETMPDVSGNLRESPNQPAVRFADDPTKPFIDRAVMIGQQLSEMRSRAPNQWNPDEAKKAIEKLAAAAKTDADKKLVAGLAEGEQQLRQLYERYQSIDRRRQLFLDQDRDLSLMIKRMQQSAGVSTSQFDAVGILRRSSTTIDNRPTYTLEDAAGLPSHYVNFPPGILAESYVGQKVGLFGQESRREGVPIPRLIVEQVAPLE